MHFDRKLPGSGAWRPGKESTREEVLRKARAERKTRAKDRQRSEAAELIQRVWRGHVCRRRVAAERLRDWVHRYGAVVGSTGALLSAEELTDAVLPPVLLSVLPPLSQLMGAVRSVGSPITAAQLVEPAAARGALALVLRSLGTQDQNSTCWSLCLDATRKAKWRSQCLQLVLLCCGVLGAQGSGGDQLLEAAAARTLLLLTDGPKQKHFQDNPDISALLREITSMLANSPPVFAASRRLVLNSGANSATTNPTDVTSRGQVLDWTFSVAVKLLDSECATSAADHFVKFVLMAHNLVDSLMSNVKLARATAVLTQLSQHALQLLQTMEAAPEGMPLDRLLALSNLTSLVVGRPVERNPGSQKGSMLVNSSLLLRKPEDVKAYAQAVTKILEVTTEEALSKGVGKGDWAGVSRGLSVFSDRAHLLQLLKALEQQAQGVELLAKLYCLLLHRLPLITPFSKSFPAGHLLNTVAFAPHFLPKLWHWLAVNIRVPLEAPLEATRGWIVESMKAGYAGLQTNHLHVLGLFCQVYSHLLLVLDDNDFHDRQDPLTLGQNRAIVATLNNLVFYTYCPNASQHQPSVSRGNPHWSMKLLEEFAPVLLRRLYERDARKSFCSALLWLAPYSAVGDDPSRRNVLSAAVVQALLNKTSGRLDPVSVSSASRAVGLANLLLCAPQCVPFDDRVEVFRGLILADKQAGRWDLSRAEGGPAPHQLTVRRGNLFGDAMVDLSRLGPNMKGRLMVTFVDEHGIEEPGLDHGGLMKELVEEVMKAGLDPQAGLFKANADGLLYPSPLAERLQQGPQMMRYLGLMLGKALYEGLLVDIPLAPFFLLRLQGRMLMFDDLASLDPELHRSLLQVKHYDGDAADLCLDFTVEDEILGQRVAEDLPDLTGSHLPGSERPVTNDNKLQYVHLVADWHVNVKVGRPAQTFASGLAEVVPLPWLRLFSPKELNALLSGGEGVDVDVENMKSFTKYSGGYSESSATVKLFWHVMSGFTPEDRAALLKFVTACSRPPLGGFKHLQPCLTIHKVDCPASPLAALGGKDVDFLPTASTCYNMLKLPNYRRAATLRKKLLYAIRSNTGFGFS
ncbi:unnamed protein product [Ostreobium quekettii]|uniref:HECT-type E3 ubiquitin transferase n=1 Tax=Ostreobium quekettii TaxID=121088 RepID=A0A8S1JFQ3_9CHLO|nr:unnamed protein product [Ostreobium quekettii]|eukprot:evm.model.scf_17.3 EVM.evm.TU.scf_17.3   scf_17:50975-62267(-)